MKVEKNEAIRLIFWELTARCNLRCVHCRAEAQEDFAFGELSTAETLRAAHDIREVADPIIVLTGGEPLVRPDFFEIAGECTKLFTRVALATNGTLIDDNLARRIVSTGIQRVSISLDGAKANTHDDFRGMEGSFAQALAGFDALKRAGASVQINVTVTRRNDAEIEDLLRLCIEKGADAFHIFMLVPVGCGVQISDSVRLSPEEFESRLVWLFEKSIEFADKIHIKATCAPQYFRIMHEQARHTKIGDGELRGEGRASGSPLHATTRGCLAGSAVCFISRTGDVQPCGYLPICVGNVRESKLGDIWRESEVFSSLRDPNRLTGKCGVCCYRTICMGCRARAYAETGDYLAAEPDCPYIPPRMRQNKSRSCL